MPASIAFRLVRAIVLLFTGTVLAQQNPNGQLPVSTSSQPYLFLIRDPLVLTDLGVNARQREAIEALNRELDPILWSMRNKGPQHMEEQMREAMATAKGRMAGILNRDQQRRLGQIELWAVGTKAFLGDDLPSALRLSDTQRQELCDRVTETQQDRKSVV